MRAGGLNWNLKIIHIQHGKAFTGLPHQMRFLLSNNTLFGIEIQTFQSILLAIGMYYRAI